MPECDCFFENCRVPDVPADACEVSDTAADTCAVPCVESAVYELQLRRVERVQASQQPEDCHAALCQRGERNRRQPRT